MSESVQLGEYWRNWVRDEAAQSADTEVGVVEKALRLYADVLAQQYRDSLKENNQILACGCVVNDLLGVGDDGDDYEIELCETHRRMPHGRLPARVTRQAEAVLQRNRTTVTTQRGC